MISQPAPEALGAAIDDLYKLAGSKKRDMGVQGLEKYRELGISWRNVVETLVGE